MCVCVCEGVWVQNNSPSQELDFSAMVVRNGHVASLLATRSANGVVGVQQPRQAKQTNI